MDVWLVNAGDDYGSASEWILEADTTLPVLLDEDESVYRSYSRGVDTSYAPFPLQVIVDQDGIIRYIAFQYDAERVREEIQSLLDAG